MQQDKRYYELSEKWLKGTITEEEKQEFNQWYNARQEEEVIIPTDFAANEEALHNRILHKIQAQKTDKPTIRLWTRTAIMQMAAAVILFFCCGSVVYYLLYRSAQNNKQSAGTVAKVKQNKVMPGNNKAVLILGDGSKIILDSSGNGMIAQQQNIGIVKLDNGQLTYTTLQAKPGDTIYNTLSTPKGGQYAITLSDGTKVWLNAASSLRFPAAFIGKSRVVELTGEAYFEVAKNPAMPFKVKVKNMEVEVLGTHFNVNAYEDENTVSTTLLEGSVKVTSGNDHKTISPAQQVIMNENGSLNVADNVDVEEVIAWKNGELRFENTKVSKIMRQLARWYDVEIAYQGNVPDVALSGIISRKEDVSQLLEILEATHKVHFQMTGNHIVVMPYIKK